MNYEWSNTAGINSLRGFSYQIKVFVLSLAKIKIGQQVEYETIEDVNIKTFDPLKLDDKCMGIINSHGGNETNYAIQVKQTTISNESAKKILFNWLLLEERGDVQEYQLFTDSSYDNDNNVFDCDKEKLFEEIKQSKARRNSLIARVKSIYGSDQVKFETAVKSIEKKHKFISSKNIDNEIFESFSDIFLKDGVEETIYQLRIRELTSFVVKGIFASIEQRAPFVCDYLMFRREAESICERIQNKKIDIDYGCFVNANPICINEFRGTREFVQLSYCGLSDTNILTHLKYKEYYQQYRMMNLGNGKTDLVDNVELTSVENFVMVKDTLQQEKRDTPINRLSETKKMENSYSSSTQIKNGALIYLTKNDVDKERQISWKDEQDE